MNKPILFLIFNRPSTTARVWAEIKKAKPKKLYVAADGPRKLVGDDRKDCEAARKIANSVNWKCNVKRLYRKNNLGCGEAVSSAINWFFENENQGIILEDDTLPNQSFFRFASDMLDKYRGDKEIMHITGGNFLDGRVKIRTSYYFSKYIHIWGWATWRRAWKNYEYGMKSWDENKSMSFLDEYDADKIEKLYWKIIFNAVKENKIDTWDYQWLYSVWANKGIGIIPNRNLIKNIGFGEGATHTKSSKHRAPQKASGLSSKYLHPQKKINRLADSYTRDRVYKINIFNILKQHAYYKTK